MRARDGLQRRHFEVLVRLRPLGRLVGAPLALCLTLTQLAPLMANAQVRPALTKLAAPSATGAMALDQAKTAIKNAAGAVARQAADSKALIALIPASLGTVRDVITAGLTRQNQNFRAKADSCYKLLTALTEAGAEDVVICLGMGLRAAPAAAAAAPVTATPMPALVKLTPAVAAPALVKVTPAAATPAPSPFSKPTPATLTPASPTLVKVTPAAAATLTPASPTLVKVTPAAPTPAKTATSEATPAKTTLAAIAPAPTAAKSVPTAASGATTRAALSYPPAPAPTQAPAWLTDMVGALNKAAKSRTIVPMTMTTALRTRAARGAEASLNLASKPVDAMVYRLINTPTFDANARSLGISAPDLLVLDQPGRLTPISASAKTLAEAVGITPAALVSLLQSSMAKPGTKNYPFYPVPVSTVQATIDTSVKRGLLPSGGEQVLPIPQVNWQQYVALRAILADYVKLVGNDVMGGLVSKNASGGTNWSPLPKNVSVITAFGQLPGLLLDGACRQVHRTLPGFAQIRTILPPGPVDLAGDWAPDGGLPPDSKTPGPENRSGDYVPAQKEAIEVCTITHPQLEMSLQRDLFILVELLVQKSPTGGGDVTATSLISVTENAAGAKPDQIRKLEALAITVPAIGSDYPLGASATCPKATARIARPDCSTLNALCEKTFKGLIGAFRLQAINLGGKAVCRISNTAENQQLRQSLLPIDDLKNTTTDYVKDRLLSFYRERASLRNYLHATRSPDTVKAIDITPEAGGASPDCNDPDPTRAAKCKADQAALTTQQTFRDARIERESLRRITSMFTQKYEYEEATNAFAASNTLQGYVTSKEKPSLDKFWSAYSTTAPERRNPELASICEMPQTEKEVTKCLAEAVYRLENHCLSPNPANPSECKATILDEKTQKLAQLGSLANWLRYQRCQWDSKDPLGYSAVMRRSFLGFRDDDPEVSNEGLQHLDKLPLSSWQRCYLLTPFRAFQPGKGDAAAYAADLNLVCSERGLNVRQPGAASTATQYAVRDAGRVLLKGYATFDELRTDYIRAHAEAHFCKSSQKTNKNNLPACSNKKLQALPDWEQNGMFSWIAAPAPVAVKCAPRAEWAAGLLSPLDTKVTGGMGIVTVPDLSPYLNTRIDSLFRQMGKETPGVDQAGGGIGDAIKSVLSSVVGMLLNAGGMNETMKTVAKAAGVSAGQSLDCEDAEYRTQQMHLPANSSKRDCILRAFAKNFTTSLESIIVMLGGKVVDWAVGLLRQALAPVKSAAIAAAGAVPFAGGFLAMLVDIVWETVFEFGIKTLLKNFVVARLPDWLGVKELAKAVKLEDLFTNPVIAVISGFILEAIEAAARQGDKSWLVSGATDIALEVAQNALNKASPFWARALIFARKEMANHPPDNMQTALKDLLVNMGKGVASVLKRNTSACPMGTSIDDALAKLENIPEDPLTAIQGGATGLMGAFKGILGPIALPLVANLVPMPEAYSKALCSLNAGLQGTSTLRKALGDTVPALLGEVLGSLKLDSSWRNFLVDLVTGILGEPSSLNNPCKIVAFIAKSGKEPLARYLQSKLDSAAAQVVNGVPMPSAAADPAKDAIKDLLAGLVGKVLDKVPLDKLENMKNCNLPDMKLALSGALSLALPDIFVGGLCPFLEKRAPWLSWICNLKLGSGSSSSSSSKSGTWNWPDLSLPSLPPFCSLPVLGWFCNLSLGSSSSSSSSTSGAWKMPAFCDIPVLGWFCRLGGGGSGKGSGSRLEISLPGLPKLDLCAVKLEQKLGANWLVPLAKMVEDLPSTLKDAVGEDKLKNLQTLLKEPGTMSLKDVAAESLKLAFPSNAEAISFYTTALAKIHTLACAGTPEKLWGELLQLIWDKLKTGVPEPMIGALDALVTSFSTELSSQGDKANLGKAGTAFLAKLAGLLKPKQGDTGWPAFAGGVGSQLLGYLLAPTDPAVFAKDLAASVATSLGKMSGTGAVILSKLLPLALSPATPDAGTVVRALIETLADTLKGGLGSLLKAAAGMFTFPATGK